MHFIAENYTYDQKLRPVGLNLPPGGAEDVKHKGVENLAGGSTPQSSPSTLSLMQFESHVINCMSLVF